MEKTIKQLADELGVSKTAVRNYMDEEFRCKYTAINRKGSITIDPDGCKLIAESMGKQWNKPQQTEKGFPEIPESSENITIPKSVWQSMERQLREKDNQIADLIAAVTAQAKSINGAQALHAGTMQQLGTGEPENKDEITVDAEPVDPQPAPVVPVKDVALEVPPVRGFKRLCTAVLDVLKGGY